MRDFVNATFGSLELAVIAEALEEWRVKAGVSRQAPEFEIAAAAIMTLFRQGHRTLPALRAAMSVHKWLSEDMRFLSSSYCRTDSGDARGSLPAISAKSAGT
ncbi:hypothetical protein LVY75_34290 (plasmid) [Sinorhizobium sp. B11]